MGILSGISKLFKRFFAFLKKLLKWLLPILAIALVVIAAFFPGAWAVVTSWANAAWTWITTSLGSAFTSAWSLIKQGATALWGKVENWLAEASLTDILKLGVGAAFLIDPKGTVKTAKSIATEVGSAVGGVASSLISGGASSLFPLLLGAGAIYLLFFREDEEGKTLLGG